MAAKKKQKSASTKAVTPVIPPEQWWSDVLEGRKEYKTLPDAMRSLTFLGKRDNGWKPGDVERGKKLITAWFADPTTAPPTFYEGTIKEPPPKVFQEPDAAPEPAKKEKREPVTTLSGMEQVALLHAGLTARHVAADALRALGNVPGVDISEAQAVVNDIVADNERITAVYRDQGMLAAPPKRDPVTKGKRSAAPPAPPPPTPPPPQEEKNETKVEESDGNGHRRPKGMPDSWTQPPTETQRRVFERNRPKN